MTRLSRLQRYLCVLVVLAVWPVILFLIPKASVNKDRWPRVLRGLARPGTVGWAQAATHGFAGRIPVLVVDTEASDSLIPISGSIDMKATNVAVGQILKPAAAIDKSTMWLAWLEREKANHGDELVILIDAGDIRFGGCSEAELLAGYTTVVRASGNAPVVMGAQLRMTPEGEQYQTHRYGEFQERMQNVLHAAGLESRPAWEGQQMRECSGRSCSSRYMFANYGFLMGPVSSLWMVVNSISRAMAPSWAASLKTLWNSPKQIGHADQGEASLYMFDHPHIVTLDYSMGVVTNLELLKESVLIRKEGDRLINTVRNKVQCFVQGMG